RVDPQPGLPGSAGLQPHERRSLSRLHPTRRSGEGDQRLEAEEAPPTRLETAVRPGRGSVREEPGAYPGQRPAGGVAGRGDRSRPGNAGDVSATDGAGGRVSCGDSVMSTSASNESAATLLNALKAAANSVTPTFAEIKEFRA